MSFVTEIFCYSEGSLTPEILARLLEHAGEHLGPSSFRSTSSRRKVSFNPKRHLPAVRSARAIDWLELQAPTGEEFSVISLGNWDFQSLSWKLSLERLHSLDVLAEMAALPGFNGGCVVDWDDVFWQSTNEINHYEIFHRDHQHLPKIQTESGRTVLDISANPGRRSGFPGLWLQAAPRMWFGGKTFDYIPRNRLLSFPEANRIEELPSGVIFIELFEDPFAAALPENRAKQKAFRDWVWMDELEQMGPGLPRGKSDPTLEIETGSFPHGGVRRVTQWMGEDRHPTRRSRAAWKLTAEYDEQGQVIWEETEKLAGEGG